MNTELTGLEVYEAPKAETVAVYWKNAILQNDPSNLEGIGEGGDNY